MIDSWMPRKLEPGFDAMYSKFERLEHVHHEVAARPIGRDGLDLAGRVGFARRNGRGRWRLRRRRGLRALGGHGARDERRGAGHGRALQKVSTIDRALASS